MKRIMRYVKGTVHHGILFPKQSSPECVGYSDADWAGDVNDRRSTSGYVFQISSGCFSWKSRKQTSVALSLVQKPSIWLLQLQHKKLCG